MIKPAGFLAELEKSGPPAYVVATGAEEYLRTEVREALHEALGEGADVVEFDAEAEAASEDGWLRLFDELRTGSLFTPTKLVVVRRAAKLIKDKTSGEALARFVNAEAPQATVFFEDDEIVKRKAKRLPAALKALEEAGAPIVDCGTLYGTPFGFGKPVWDSDLSRWVVEHARRLGKRMTMDCAFLLHSRETAGLRGVAAQLEKLVVALGDRDEIRPEDVEAFCGGEQEADVFEVVDAFAYRDSTRTMSALARLYRQGVKNNNGARSLDQTEISMRLLALIATRLRELGRIMEHRRDGLSFDEAAAKVVGGGRRWLFPKLGEQLESRSPRELGAAVVDLERLDRDLKSGGGAPRDLMTLFLLRHARPTSAGKPMAQVFARMRS